MKVTNAAKAPPGHDFDYYGYSPSQDTTPRAPIDPRYQRLPASPNVEDRRMEQPGFDALLRAITGPIPEPPRRPGLDQRDTPLGQEAGMSTLDALDSLRQYNSPIEPIWDPRKAQ